MVTPAVHQHYYAYLVYLADVPAWSFQMISVALVVWVVTWCMEPMSIWTLRNTNQLTIAVSMMVYSPTYDLIFLADRPPSKAFTQPGHSTRLEGELSDAESASDEPENEGSVSIKCKQQRQARQRRATNSMFWNSTAVKCVLNFSPFTQHWQASVRRVIIQ